MSTHDLSLLKADLSLLLETLGLQAAGSQKCPFHADQNNSFQIRQYQGVWRWKCFAGCGQGTIIGAVAKLKNISAKEAIKQLTSLPHATSKKIPREINTCGMWQPERQRKLRITNY